jgi:hypothetical protein
MRSYNLNIAGYNIRLESASDGPDLQPSDRFRKYSGNDPEYDILITIHSGSIDLPKDAERIFHAPYVEEINGFILRHKPNFWSIWKYSNHFYIKTLFPLTIPERNALLKFSLTTREWDLWIDGPDKATDPFEYPLDGLILYYLTVIYGDIMIHASGVSYKGRGYLFSGVSGRGKSTMAMLWDNFGAKVVHDDRLILRKINPGYQMFNTPVYNNEDPLDSPVHKIFIIEHGTENNILPVKGAAAVSMVLANCIQHNWGHEIIARLLGSISIMCGVIPVTRLSFKPDSSIIDYIIENE